MPKTNFPETLSKQKVFDQFRGVERKRFLKELVRKFKKSIL